MTASPLKPLALVIEDDPNISIIIAEALRQAGFEVEVIRESTRGMARLRETMPALLTLDMHMPEMSGLDLLAKIRADPTYDSLQILLITGDTVKAAAVNVPGVQVLIKPVSFVSLRDLASRMLG
jgi:DNA-binding response OmpR family regulator